jgi:hypothetical protein
MGKTRKIKRRSEATIRSKVISSKYDIFLDKNVYYGEDPFKLPADDDWDPKTGTCAMHSLFTIDALGVKIPESIKQYIGFKEVNPSKIDTILTMLDKGSIVECLHTYRDKSIIHRLPRNNLYGSHDFVLVKGGSKYFLSQGFLFAYKHSLRAYTKDQLIKLLTDILEYLCDYDDTKKWKDLDLEYYKKYFKTDLRVGGISRLPVDMNKKVHSIVLEYVEIR